MNQVNEEKNPAVPSGQPTKDNSLSAWQTIETAPFGVQVLIHNPKWAEPIQMVRLKDTARWVESYGPTHWMPLPAPPNTQDTESSEASHSPDLSLDSPASLPESESQAAAREIVQWIVHAVPDTPNLLVALANDPLINDEIAFIITRHFPESSSSSTSRVKRWDLVYHEGPESRLDDATMEESPTGTYVKYDDLSTSRVWDELTRERDTLREALEELSVRRGKDGTLCWCDAWDWTKHDLRCAKARSLAQQEDK